MESFLSGRSSCLTISYLLPDSNRPHLPARPTPRFDPRHPQPRPCPRAGRSPRRPAQHGGSRQQKRKRLRWKASSRPGSGAYTCSRKASGRPQRAHASDPGPGSPARPSHAGRPPTLLGNCSLRSLQAGASSAKPSSTGPGAAMGSRRGRGVWSPHRKSDRRRK